ncbi:hypothetical protein DFH08DRAFT_963726 [Mycena albidolilacea]|uniref:Uncharacterized protein n=1 Tax=Mycena albidolilacea TaxID=1033008 RepID=A0AAD7ENN0_9AGAR|nr:hypothetical protein DFH08DRAFT_963726 [Mycena albidolilacea]
MVLVLRTYIEPGTTGSPKVSHICIRHWSNRVWTKLRCRKATKIISDPRLKVRLKDCTLDHIRSVLNPGILPGIYREDAPYTWDFLSVFTTSPNEYRKKRARKGEKGKLAVPVEADEWEEAASGSSGEKPDFAGDTGGFWRNMGGEFRWALLEGFRGHYARGSS